MAKKESTIIYDKHVEICSKYLTDEQFGKLMFTLTMGKEPDFGDDKVLSMAFAFISLQKDLDDKKYEEKCKKNRANGKLGGRPKKGEEKPKKPNGFFENPNDNEKVNEKEKEKVNDNDNGFHDDHSLFLGSFQNVRLSETEHAALKQQYERTNELIDKVSVWLRSAKNEVPDHYGLCVKFAQNDGWPKRRTIEPVELPEVEDPLSEEEQERKVLEMRSRINAAFAEG